MMRRSLGSVLAAGAALALVAGCSNAASTAANVDGQIITTAQLDETFEGCQAQGVQFPNTDAPKAWLLSSMILNRASRDIAQAKDIDIDDADVQSLASQSQTWVQASKDESCKKLLLDSQYFSIVLDQVTEPTFLEELASMDIEANPRFGQWNADPASGQLGVSGSGSLSELSQPVQQ